MGKAKKRFTEIFTIITGCLSLFFAGLTSSNSTLVNQEATYKRIAKLSESNDHGYAYATICYGESGGGEAGAALSYNYGSNFSGSQQIIPACFDSDTNELKTFEAGFGAMGAVHIGNLITYTNQKALRRFETAWINVYDNDLFNPHAYHGDGDGFVFIPDFYADELIAGSNGAYKSYDDLLPSSASSSSASDFQYLTIADGELIRRWSIVGIYHAKGFDAGYLGGEFAYNDGKFGDAVNLLGAPFLIAYDSSFFSKRLNGLTVFCSAKQYSIEEQIKTVAAYDEDRSSYVTFYSVKDGVPKKMDGYSSVSVAFLFQSDVPPLYFAFMALAIASVVAFFFLVRALPYEKPLSFLCYTALGPFVFSLVGSLCANFFGQQIAFLYPFFSYYFGAFVLIVSGIAVGFLIRGEKKKRGASDEE